VTDLTELQSADAYCRFLANHHYENFSVVSLFLPRDIRRHLVRIYAFCRTTDDLGDETNGAAGKADAIARLESWRTAVFECFAGLPAVHPVLIALRPTIRDRKLDRQPFLDLIQANIQDQSLSQYQDWNALWAYCMLSAAPVGRMVLRVFGVEDVTATRLSDDVCIGLQLANHAQDVMRDGEKGRTYVLQEEIEGSGMTAAIQGLCTRARSLLLSGTQLERMTPMPLRAQLALYRLGGNAILDAIEDVDYRTDYVRPTVSTWTKSRLIPVALMESMKANQVLSRHAA
jgi:squalene synthase HpnC